MSAVPRLNNGKTFAVLLSTLRATPWSTLFPPGPKAQRLLMDATLVRWRQDGTDWETVAAYLQGVGIDPTRLQRAWHSTRVEWVDHGRVFAVTTPAPGFVEGVEYSDGA